MKSSVKLLRPKNLLILKVFNITIIWDILNLGTVNMDFKVQVFRDLRAKDLEGRVRDMEDKVKHLEEAI